MLLRLLLIICIHIPVVCCCQQLIMLNDSANVSIRGMSVVNDNIVWVSGSNGMTGRSVDGGNTWQWKQVKGFEKNDFRDIEAFDAVTAVIMSIGDPAYILKTNDGGNTWKVVFEDKRKGMFLDAMEFWNEQSGIVIGDPVEGKIFIARTFDGGDTWQHLPVENYPAAKDGEAFFAASGTNVRALSLSEAVFVSGGQYSRFFMRDEKTMLPVLQGSQTTGANSIAVFNNKNRKAAKQMVVVGGDFTADTLAVKNAALSADGGKTWVEPQTPPHGYRSCVEYISRSRLITCGTSGVDVSEDGGKNWKLISKESFHVCRKAKNGKAVFLAGKGGRIAQLLWQ
ncbi:MAG: oxidoreductase [Chitinophagaceae bacterium]|nr:oxidoreductase [Chitinophagaceae bacterium]